MAIGADGFGCGCVGVNQDGTFFKLVGTCHVFNAATMYKLEYWGVEVLAFQVGAHLVWPGTRIVGGPFQRNASKKHDARARARASCFFSSR